MHTHMPLFFMNNGSGVCESNEGTGVSNAQEVRKIWTDIEEQVRGCVRRWKTDQKRWNLLDRLTANPESEEAALREYERLCKAAFFQRDDKSRVVTLSEQCLKLILDGLCGAWGTPHGHEVISRSIAWPCQWSMTIIQSGCRG